VFSFLKRQSKAQARLTFKERVERFWKWYAEVAPRFYEVIESGQCGSLLEEVSDKVEELLPDFAWEFGPGKDDKGHSFSLIGEGIIHRQLLTIYWLDRAPILPGWTFYASRQPCLTKSGGLAKIETEDGTFNPIEFWLTPALDRENEKVDITVWHPLFDKMGEKERAAALFLYLDSVLGEYGTGQWIGEVEYDPKRLTESIPLAELGEYIEKIKVEQRWKKPLP